MKSLSRTGNALTLRDMIVLALCAALMIAAQVGLAALPNAELVSLFVMLFARHFKRRSLYIIYVFVLVEGLIYGFGLWWYSYLYVWTCLAGAVWLFRDMASPWFFASLSGTFGLVFGALCALPYLFIGGVSMMAAYWTAGILFDLWHGVCNFAIGLALWRPLNTLLRRFSGGGG